MTSQTFERIASPGPPMKKGAVAEAAAPFNSLAVSALA
jgi:hypothetical protein